MDKVTRVKHEDLGLDFQQPSKEMGTACSCLQPQNRAEGGE